MSSHRHLQLWSVALASLLTWSASAQGQDFVRTRARLVDANRLACVTWDTRSLTFRIASPADNRTWTGNELLAFEAALISWRQVSATCSDFAFAWGANVENAPIDSTDRKHTVRIITKPCMVQANDPCKQPNADVTCTEAYQCWLDSSATIALATTSYSTRSGVLADADIALNAVNFFFTTVNSPPCPGGRPASNCVANDLQNTLTHELGHVLGLDHVQTRADSTMLESAPLGETTKRTIDTGTAAGFCQIYPKDKPPLPCDPVDQQRYTVTGRTACAISPALAFCLLRPRRRRRAV
jgi:hypothetical protein